MKYNKLFLFVIFGFIASPATAQMLDTLSGLAIQGTLTKQSTQSVAHGLSRVKQLQVLQDINRVAMEIKTIYFNGYTGVNPSSVSGRPFPNLSWTIAPNGFNQFYIQLNQLDKQTCSYLVGSVTNARDIKINGVSGNNSLCRDQNTIQFIFD